MPFRYDTPDAPAAGSIAALMLRRGQIAADQAQAVAAAQGRGQELSGAAWANTFNNIGQTVAAIPGQIQQQKNAALEQQVRQQQVEQGTKAIADMKALDTAYQQPGGRDAIIGALPGHLRPQVQKQFTDADEAAAKVQDTQLKVAEAQNDYFGGLAANIRDHGYDPNAAQLAFSHAKQTYAGNPTMLQQIGQYEQQVQSNPGAIRPLIDHLIGVSQKQRSSDSAATSAAARAATAAKPTAATLAVEAVNGNGLSQDALDKINPPKAANTGTIHDTANGLVRIGADNTITPLGVKGYHPPPASVVLNGQTDAAMRNMPAWAMDASRPSGPDGNKIDKTIARTPNGLFQDALGVIQEGKYPPISRGNGPTATALRAAIDSKVGAIASDAGMDVPQLRAFFKANEASLKGMQKTYDSAAANIATADRNSELLTAALAKMPDTGSPLLNKPLRSFAESVKGDTNMAPIATYLASVQNEYGKLISSASGNSSVLSDSARHEAQNLIKPNATVAQMLASIKALQTEGNNRLLSTGDQIKAIQSRMKVPSGQTPQAPSTIRARDPQGVLHEAPAGTPLPTGWKQEG